MADQTFQSELYAYLTEYFRNPVFLLTTQGNIIEANLYAKNLISRDLTDVNIREVILDFQSTFDLSKVIESSKEIILNVGTGSGSPQSYYFVFKPFNEHILAIGRSDSEGVEALQSELLKLNNELNNLSRELYKKNAQLQDALDHVKTLQGVLPICMHCHQIRNDKQLWDRLEVYFSNHSELEFSHGICPECAEKHYPDMDLYKE